jgi:hypothetical protein
MSDNFHPVFIGPRGGIVSDPKVPRSCIEATETVLRSAFNPSYRFTKGGLGSSESSPAMFVHLKNGYNTKSVNVTDNDSDDTFAACQGNKSFFAEDQDLTAVMALGRGITFINVSKEDQDGYNMHFLGVLKVTSYEVVFADVSEPDDWDQRSTVSLTIRRTASARTVRELRAFIGAPYTNKEIYACGLVTLTPTV